jgi:hypothetical protein
MTFNKEIFKNGYSLECICNISSSSSRRSMPYFLTENSSQNSFINSFSLFSLGICVSLHKPFAKNAIERANYKIQC